MVKIYALIDPLKNECRYIGKTMWELRNRLRDHISESKKKKFDTRKNEWVFSLVVKKMKPFICLIEEVEDFCWEESEKFWISYYISIGCDLTNSTSGGIGFGDKISQSKNCKKIYREASSRRKLFVDGMVFSSISKTAKHFGISSETVKKRANSNKPEFSNWLWVDESGNPILKDVEEKKNRVCLDGVIYDSVTEASKKTGIHKNTIDFRLKSKSKRFVNWFYLSFKEVAERNCDNYNKKPVSIEGIFYDSISSASRKLGLSCGSIRKRLNSKKKEYFEWNWLNEDGLEVEKEIVDDKNRISICGEEYKNTSEAAKTFGISTHEIRKRLKSKKYPNWFYVDYVKRTVNANAKNSIKVMIENVVYKSISEASKILGVTKKTVVRRINSNSEKFIEWMFLGHHGELIQKEMKPKKNRVSVDGIVYDTISIAVKKLGMSLKQIYSRIKSKKYPNWFYVDYKSPKKSSSCGKRPVSIENQIYESISDAIRKTSYSKKTITYRIKSTKPEYDSWFYINDLNQKLQRF